MWQAKLILLITSTFHIICPFPLPRATSPFPFWCSRDCLQRFNLHSTFTRIPRGNREHTHTQIHSGIYRNEGFWLEGVGVARRQYRLAVNISCASSWKSPSGCFPFERNLPTYQSSRSSSSSRSDRHTTAPGEHGINEKKGERKRTKGTSGSQKLIEEMLMGCLRHPSEKLNDH